jgi:hypothetical protein
MLATGDLGLLPEYELHQRATDSVLYDEKAKPLPELLNAARETNVSRLVKLLENTDPTLRWWARSAWYRSVPK